MWSFIIHYLVQHQFWNSWQVLKDETQCWTLKVVQSWSAIKSQRFFGIFFNHTSFLKDFVKSISCIPIRKLRQLDRFLKKAVIHTLFKKEKKERSLSHQQMFPQILVKFHNIKNPNRMFAQNGVHIFDFYAQQQVWKSSKGEWLAIYITLSW